MSRSIPRTPLPAALGLVTAAGATATVFGTPAGAATAGCKVEYQITDQWNTGFGAGVVVTNTGAPLAAWTLEWTYANGQQVSQGWSAAIAQSGAAATAKSLSYNGSRQEPSDSGVGALPPIGVHQTSLQVRTPPVLGKHIVGGITTGAVKN
ncbi:cellulose binding domain-containing protein [Streptomyces sp. NPDC059708]|uniref:cellulose binding domain-containing protein n=1 Tax=Streptomyces sp. NPDC059708 TaxID=3346916 RepID=UPI00368C5C8D